MVAELLLVPATKFRAMKEAFKYGGTTLQAFFHYAKGAFPETKSAFFIMIIKKVREARAPSALSVLTFLTQWITLMEIILNLPK